MAETGNNGRKWAASVNFHFFLHILKFFWHFCNFSFLTPGSADRPPIRSHSPLGTPHWQGHQPNLGWSLLSDTLGGGGRYLPPWVFSNRVTKRRLGLARLWSRTPHTGDRPAAACLHLAFTSAASPKPPGPLCSLPHQQYSRLHVCPHVLCS